MMKREMALNTEMEEIGKKLEAIREQIREANVNRDYDLRRELLQKENDLMHLEYYTMLKKEEYLKRRARRRS